MQNFLHNFFIYLVSLVTSFLTHHHILVGEVRANLLNDLSGSYQVASQCGGSLSLYQGFLTGQLGQETIGDCQLDNQGTLVFNAVNCGKISTSLATCNGGMGGDNFTLTFTTNQYVGSVGQIGGSRSTDGTSQIEVKIVDENGLTHHDSNQDNASKQTFFFEHSFTMSNSQNYLKRAQSVQFVIKISPGITNYPINKLFVWSGRPVPTSDILSVEMQNIADFLTLVPLVQKGAFVDTRSGQTQGQPIAASIEAIEILLTRDIVLEEAIIVRTFPSTYTAGQEVGITLQLSTSTFVPQPPNIVLATPSDPSSLPLIFKSGHFGKTLNFRFQNAQAFTLQAIWLIEANCQSIEMPGLPTNVQTTVKLNRAIGSIYHITYLNFNLSMPGCDFSFERSTSNNNFPSQILQPILYSRSEVNDSQTVSKSMVSTFEYDPTFFPSTAQTKTFFREVTVNVIDNLNNSGGYIQFSTISQTVKFEASIYSLNIFSAHSVFTKQNRCVQLAARPNSNSEAITNGFYQLTTDSTFCDTFSEECSLACDTHFLSFGEPPSSFVRIRTIVIIVDPADTGIEYELWNGQTKLDSTFLKSPTESYKGHAVINLKQGLDQNRASIIRLKTKDSAERLTLQEVMMFQEEEIFSKIASWTGVNMNGVSTGQEEFSASTCAQALTTHQEQIITFDVSSYLKGIKLLVGPYHGQNSAPNQALFENTYDMTLEMEGFDPCEGANPISQSFANIKIEEALISCGNKSSRNIKFTFKEPVGAPPITICRPLIFLQHKLEDDSSIVTSFVQDPSESVQIFKVGYVSSTFVNEIYGSSFSISQTTPNQYNVVPTVTNSGVFPPQIFDIVESSETSIKIDGTDPIYESLIGTETTIQISYSLNIPQSASLHTLSIKIRFQHVCDFTTIQLRSVTKNPSFLTTSYTPQSTLKAELTLDDNLPVGLRSFLENTVAIDNGDDSFCGPYIFTLTDNANGILSYASQFLTLTFFAQESNIQSGITQYTGSAEVYLNDYPNLNNKLSFQFEITVKEKDSLADVVQESANEYPRFASALTKWTLTQNEASLYQLPAIESFQDTPVTFHYLSGPSFVQASATELKIGINQAAEVGTHRIKLALVGQYGSENNFSFDLQIVEAEKEKSGDESTNNDEGNGDEALADEDRDEQIAEQAAVNQAFLDGILGNFENREQNYFAIRIQPEIQTVLISSFGKLLIKFNTKMDFSDQLKDLIFKQGSQIGQNLKNKAPQNRLLNSRALELFKLEIIFGQDSQYENERKVSNYTWSVESVEKREIGIQISFENAETISILAESQDQIKIVFLREEFFRSIQGGLTLKNDFPVQYPLPKQASLAEMEIMQATADTVKQASSVLVFSNGVPGILMRASLNYLISLVEVNMLVMLTSLFKVELPIQLQFYQAAILEVVRFEVFSIQDQLEEFSGVEPGPPYNQKMEALGLEQTLIMYNIALIFLYFFALWPFLFLIYIFVALLAYIKGSRSLWRVKNSLHSGLFWQNTLAFFMAEIIILGLSVAINLNQFDYAKQGFINFVTLTLNIIACFILPFAGIFQIWWKQEGKLRFKRTRWGQSFEINNLGTTQSIVEIQEKERKYIIKTWGPLVEKQKINGTTFVIFKSLHFVRIIAFLVVIFAFEDYLIFQIAFLQLQWMIYIGIVSAWKPFVTKAANQNKILEETLLLVVVDHLLVIVAVNKREMTRYVGISLIILSLSHLLGSILINFWFNLKQMLFVLKVKCRHAKYRREKKKKQENLKEAFSEQKIEIEALDKNGESLSSRQNSISLEQQNSQNSEKRFSKLIRVEDRQDMNLYTEFSRHLETSEHLQSEQQNMLKSRQMKHNNDSANTYHQSFREQVMSDLKQGHLRKKQKSIELIEKLIIPESSIDQMTMNSEIEIQTDVQKLSQKERKLEKFKRLNKKFHMEDIISQQSKEGKFRAKYEEKVKRMVNDTESINHNNLVTLDLSKVDAVMATQESVRGDKEINFDFKNYRQRRFARIKQSKSKDKGESAQSNSQYSIHDFV